MKRGAFFTKHDIDISNWRLLIYWLSKLNSWSSLDNLNDRLQLILSLNILDAFLAICLKIKQTISSSRSYKINIFVQYGKSSFRLYSTFFSNFPRVSFVRNGNFYDRDGIDLEIMKDVSCMKPLVEDFRSRPPTPTPTFPNTNMIVIFLIISKISNCSKTTYKIRSTWFIFCS